MTRDQEKCFTATDQTTAAVVALLGEWIATEAQDACTGNVPDSERIHRCGRADSLWNVRDHIKSLIEQNKKID